MPLPVAAAKLIGPLPFISQTLNNCGPASVAEVLDYWGVPRTQAQVAAVLRPDQPRYGMSLFGVPFYAQSVGMLATGGVGGSDRLIKAFVSNGVPVIVADLVSPIQRIRHFRPIDGYNDAGAYFTGSDPYLGPRHRISYASFDSLWAISGNRFVAIYPPAKRDLVNAILSSYWNGPAAYQSWLAKVRQRTAKGRSQAWSWMERADAQIHLGDLSGAQASLQQASFLGLPFEAHWLELDLRGASVKTA